MREGLLILTVAIQLTAADNWPQWRGPNRDGAAPSFRGPAAWPEKLQTKWKITVGEGHSSPIFGEGKIFQFARLNGLETLSAIDPATGKMIWTQSYDAPFTMNVAAWGHGKGPKSTPVYANGRVFTFGIGGILSSFAASDGKLLWRKEFSKQFKNTSPDFGVAMSPIVREGLLIAHVGGDKGGALTAFDTATGEEKWRWSGDGPAYASPVIGVFEQIPQIVTFSQRSVFAVHPATGQLLWQMPYTTPYEENNITPVVVNDTLLLSGLDAGIKAVKPVLKNGSWTCETLWETKAASFSMNTPVLTRGGSVIGFSHKNKGQIVAIDPKTGAIEWSGDPRQGENAAIVTGAGVVLVLTNESLMTVLRNDAKQFAPVRVYTVADSPVWAHPLPLESGIVVKDAKTLALLSWN
jgi:outer membrane protein assembly factor BamB